MCSDPKICRKYISKGAKLSKEYTFLILNFNILSLNLETWTSDRRIILGIPSMRTKCQYTTAWLWKFGIHKIKITVDLMWCTWEDTMFSSKSSLLSTGKIFSICTTGEWPISLSARGNAKLNDLFNIQYSLLGSF